MIMIMIIVVTSEDFMMANIPRIQQQQRQAKIDSPMWSCGGGNTAVVTTGGCWKEILLFSYFNPFPTDDVLCHFTLANA